MASVAEVIRRDQSQIVADWIGKAQAAASARGLSGPTFTNQMPMFLAALAEGMGGASADAAARSRAEALGHLGTRIRQGFELSEMVGEFDILERSIVAACAKALSAEQPDKAEMERLHEQIRDAITDVTDAYFHHVMEDEQVEKRYSRLLQDIATEALRDARRPLRERLHDVLEVVVDAMSARSAAFLLFDVHEDRLVEAASVGDEVFEQYATSLDRASFAGQVAGSATATSMRDVTSTVLEVPESLRKSGIHSVLGVRIPARSDLQAILYVGVTEIREFTTREIHRLELLADRLGLHLENARLFADLRATIEALRAQ